MQDRRNYLIYYNEKIATKKLILKVNETARERMKDLEMKKSEIVRERCK